MSEPSDDEEEAPDESWMATFADTITLLMAFFVMLLTFAEFDIPHAKGDLFVNPWRAHQFAKQHGFPLCIKPNVSGYSRGSHFPIRNFRELWKAAILVKVWWPVSVVEQYLLGANYRVLATPNEIVSVIRRYPPFVDGDGTHSNRERWQGW